MRTYHILFFNSLLLETVIVTYLPSSWICDLNGSKPAWLTLSRSFKERFIWGEKGFLENTYFFLSMFFQNKYEVIKKTRESE